MRWLLIVLLPVLTLFSAESFTERLARIELARDVVAGEVRARTEELARIAEDLARIGQAAAANPQNLALKDSQQKRENRRLLVTGQLKEWQASQVRVDAAYKLICEEVVKPFAPPPPKAEQE